MKDALYTPEELGEILKISKYTVYEMIKRGDLEAHRIGRSLRISEQQLDRFLKKQGSGRNVLSGTVKDTDNGKAFLINGLEILVSTPLARDVQIHIPPEAIFLSNEKVHTTARNCFKGIVTSTTEEEDQIFVTLYLPSDAGGLSLDASITKSSLKEFDIRIDKELYLFFKVMSVEVF